MRSEVSQKHIETELIYHPLFIDSITLGVILEILAKYTKETQNILFLVISLHNSFRLAKQNAELR